MSNILSGRHLLTLMNHTAEEIVYLLNLAQELKEQKKNGVELARMQRKNIALIFEKSSTRTRCSFEVAAYDQGAQVTYLDGTGSQIGHKESLADTARVLGRMYDAIEFRGASHSTVETLAKYAGIPIFNGLTDEHHPTQALADVLTMHEYVGKPMGQIKVAYVGDANNNVATSLMVIAAKLGMTIHFAAPKEYWPNEEMIAKCRAIAEENEGVIECFEDPKAAVDGVDFIYTDVWLSMGEAKEKWGLRIQALFPYQVNRALMEAANNPNVKFMHCLPAFHNAETTEGADLMKHFPELKDGVEVTDEIFESDYSIVFDQAENRLHTIKAVMVASIGELR